jgi:hypothetical protein
MICDKCGSGMHQEYVDYVESFSCIMCGNIIYPGFPKRIGTFKDCEACGKTFEGTGILCIVCRPKRKTLCVCGILFFKKGNQRYCSKKCTTDERKKRRKKL